MQATSTAFRTMVEGVDQVASVAINLTLPAVASAWNDVTLAVESLTIDASTTTDVPAGARLQAGYPAREATITLSGLVDRTDETKTAAWAFNPYSTDSLLYRQQRLLIPVTIDLGLHPEGSNGTAELVRKFTGRVDTITTDPVAGTVTLSCIDLRSTLRGALSMPAAVTGDPGQTSEYVIDTLIRSATSGAVSTWRPPRASQRLGVGFRTSVWPETGTLIQDAVTRTVYARPKYAAGATGTGITATPSSTGGDYLTVVYNLSKRLSSLDASPVTAYIEFTVTRATDSYTSAAYSGITVSLFGAPWSDVPANGAFWFSLAVSSSGVGVATNPAGAYTYIGPVLDNATHHVAVKTSLNFGANQWSATVWVDGVSYTTGTKTGVGTTDGSGGMTTTTAQLDMGGGIIEGLQVTAETSGSPVVPFTPTAVIAPSLNALTGIPPVEGDPWQAIQQVAAAELAVAGFDEHGIFRYVTRDMTTTTASVRDVTSTTSLKNLEIQEAAAALINHATVGYTTWTTGNPTLIYNSTVAIKVARNLTRSFNFTLPYYVDAIAYAGNPLPNGHTTGDGKTWFRASKDGAGVNEVSLAEMNTYLTVRAQQVAANKIRVTIANASPSFDAWFVVPSTYTDITVGTPSLWVGGRVVTVSEEAEVEAQWPTIEAGGALSSKWGEQAYALTGNPWIQDLDTATDLATDLATSAPVPRPDLTNVDIVPDPTLQLGDRLRIVDTAVSNVNEYAVLYGEHLSLQEGDYSHAIDARTVAAPGGWILGVTGRSQLGVTTNV